MTMKRNPTDDVDKRTEHAGSAAATPGLNPLDQEREASLADEGGASGATIESQDLETLKKIASELPLAHLQDADAGKGWSTGSKVACVASTLAAAAVGVALYIRTR